ncbi:carboxylesterase/lipase family protein [Nocardioides dilutus]
MHLHRGPLAILAILVVLAAVAGCRETTGASADAAPVVETAAGPVRGLAHDGIESWLGVPYAAPPVDDFRWRPPQPVEPWSEVRDGRDYGPVCLQGPPPAELVPELHDSSEDCLNLNVHGPAGVDEALPVMVWIHGGGFAYGAGSQATYNSAALVRRGVVLVTLNYRLGRLGFLAHPALQDDGSRIGNYGLLDQVAALAWVRDNIAAFGGDPDNVTVFGESAGGIAVNALMASPSAEGLFDRAISQSGFGREATLAWDDAVTDASAALEPLVGPSPTAADLRTLDGEQVMDLPINIYSGNVPLLDDVLPSPVPAAFMAGDEADVPYLNGVTTLEVPDIPAGAGAVADPVRARLLAQDRPQARAAYGSDEELERHVTSDVLLTEPARLLAREHADDAPTYRYYFGIAPDAVLAAGGAPHGAELPFVLDDTARQGTPVPDADALADQVSALWVDFASDGEPDGWPTADTGQVMTFTVDGPVTGPDPWTARLDVVEAAFAAVTAAVQAD